MSLLHKHTIAVIRTIFVQISKKDTSNERFSIQRIVEWNAPGIPNVGIFCSILKVVTLESVNFIYCTVVLSVAFHGVFIANTAKTRVIPITGVTFEKNVKK